MSYEVKRGSLYSYNQNTDNTGQYKQFLSGWHLETSENKQAGGNTCGTTQMPYRPGVVNIVACIGIPGTMAMSNEKGDENLGPWEWARRWGRAGGGEEGGER